MLFLTWGREKVCFNLHAIFLINFQFSHRNVLFHFGNKQIALVRAVNLASIVTW